MAFSSPKTISEYGLVSSFDPALDWERGDRRRYEEDYEYDARHLVFKEGQAPTLFRVRPLSARLLARLLDRMMRGQESGQVELAVHEAALLAFRWGVYDIENLPGFDAARHVQAGNPSAIKESWLDEGHLPMDVLSEIGTVIMARARLSALERKN